MIQLSELTNLGSVVGPRKEIIPIDFQVIGCKMKVKPICLYI